MSISSEQLKHLSTLAYLELNPATAPTLIDDINSIINFVDHLRSIDTTNVEPLMHPMDAFQRLRPDESQECDVARQLGKIAPQFEDNLYLVPKVIK